ncbi:hypothetical protein PR002_g1702 [Phytophthora rubi]|uniref:Uncharacterized protein n=1 Tax=Phytophthora rubi TaxID=129364 RepID=A0A6A3NYQ5_9STRA|nr:hypothetical protein PR002_g1702 [Phytophthora rubi]
MMIRKADLAGKPVVTATQMLLSASKTLLLEPADEEVAASLLLLFEVDDTILPMVSVSVDDVSDCTYTENVYAIDPLIQ